jgi:uncharacterized membrane protein
VEDGAVAVAVFQEGEVVESGKSEILSNDFKNKILQLIQDFETHSVVEVVPCFADKSSDYRFLRMGISSLLSVVITSSILPFLPWNLDRAWFGLLLYTSQFAFFYVSCFRIFLNIPLRSIQDYVSQKVRLRALQAFHEFEIYKSAKGRGLLFFVSVNEKRFHLIPDSELMSKLDHTFWHEKVKKLEATLSKTVDFEKDVFAFLSELLKELTSIFPQGESANDNLVSNKWINLKP